MAKILSAMSGGVDSSVATKLLLDEGHEVTGVTLDLFCISDTETPVKNAKAVCDRLGIEHRAYNAHSAFFERVISPFVETYLAGETPNPCVVCNRRIKFGILVDYALEQGFDAVATGHYARLDRDDESGRYRLLKGIDPAKDQSYVLYSLSRNQLAHARFPLGSLDKATVRRIAVENGFAGAKAKESQDICFIPDGDYQGFIDRAAPGKVQPGPYLSVDGEQIGTHQGVTRYTIGQRRGIGVGFGKPMYVVAKDAVNNTVTLGENNDLLSGGLIANEVNFIPFDTPREPLPVAAKIRYNQKEQPAVVRMLPDGSVEVLFDKPQRAVAPGQSVFLPGRTCCRRHHPPGDSVIAPENPRQPVNPALKAGQKPLPGSRPFHAARSPLWKDGIPEHSVRKSTPKFRRAGLHSCRSCGQ